VLYIFRQFSSVQFVFPSVFFAAKIGFLNPKEESRNGICATHSGKTTGVELLDEELESPVSTAG
jgi:hypothetical protein